MFRQCLLLAFAALSACATTSGAPTPNDYRTRNASVAGVIALQGPENSGCDGLTVVAKSGDAQLGVATIRTSRERCSYQIDSLPSDTDVTIDIKPPESWACANGTKLSFSPAPGTAPLKLRDHEMRTQDFRAACAPL